MSKLSEIFNREIDLIKKDENTLGIVLVGSCKDLIHDNGWLIKQTVDNLVKAIEEAISIYPLEKFNNYQSNSLSLYETYYTEESMCREHAKMYKKVIEARQ